MAGAALARGVTLARRRPVQRVGGPCGEEDATPKTPMHVVLRIYLKQISNKDEYKDSASTYMNNKHYTCQDTKSLLSTIHSSAFATSW